MAKLLTTILYLIMLITMSLNSLWAQEIRPDVLRTPDARFENLPGYNFEPHYVIIDGYRIHYIDEGPSDGQVILMLHGEPSWSYLYRKMIPIFTEAGYRSIAPDLIGFGRSDKPTTMDVHTYQFHVDTQAALIEALDLTNVTFVGQDWGGLAGLRIVAENEDRFSRVAIANTGLPDPSVEPIGGAFMGWKRRNQGMINTGDIDTGTLIATITGDPSVKLAYDAPFPDPTYKAGLGPLNISVVDPVKIPQGNYIFKLFDPEFSGSSISSYNSWELINQQDGAVIGSSNQSITVGTEEYISSLGLNVKVKQSLNPGSDPNNIDDNGLVSSSIEYENINDRWLSGVPDRDDEGGFLKFWGLNWIRSGTYTDDDNGLYSDYNQTDDPKSIYEGVIEQTITTTFSNIPFGIGDITFETTGGTWAPYRFASYYQDGPGLNSSITSQNKMENLNSVDVVYTNDKSKWTRCVIVEAQENPDLAEGGALKMGLRESPSVDKNGSNDGSGRNGMGWFPGYAIDVETGERLNIVFAEDSWLTSDNGNDMQWNPTSNIVTEQFPFYSSQTQEISGGNYLLGGKHFVYVINGQSWVKGTADYVNGNFDDVDNSPNYDEGEWIYHQLKEDATGVGKWKVFKNTSWVSIPLLAPGRTLLTNEAKVKLRVSKPYKQYETVNSLNILSKDDALTIGETYVVAYENSATTWGGKTITHDGTTYSPGDVFQATATSFTGSSKARVVLYNPANSFNPIYEFNTDDLVATKGDSEVARDAMELINVVPNPYYGYSEYESNQLDNRIKITNLPQTATISVFTVNGTLVRKLKKDDTMTSIDWDLKNNFGIPIASGLYIIHVATEIDGEKREKVIKWFGTLRPIDLDTF